MAIEKNQHVHVYQLVYKVILETYQMDSRAPALPYVDPVLATTYIV